MKAEISHSIRRSHLGARALTLVIVLAIFLTFSYATAQKPAASPINHYFRAFDVFIDSKDKALAAYQMEVSFSGANAKIVGIEGGKHKAFEEPPVYDPKAIQNERIIIAAFSTNPAATLPKGRTRIATLHVQTAGEEQQPYEVFSTVAATANGQKIAITTSVEERKSK
jgi:hypothetical protein